MVGNRYCATSRWLPLFALLGLVQHGCTFKNHAPLNFQWRRRESQIGHLTGAFFYHTALLSSGDGRSDEKKEDTGGNQGYKFGDISRGALGRFRAGVNSLTGKTTYEFGDLTKWVGLQAKEEIFNMDQSSKERVQQFTNRSKYQLGDITRELVRRLQEGEYNADDIWLFFRIVLLVGRKFVPSVAATLPVKVLMELAEISVVQSVGEDLTTIFTNEINQRMKQWITGDKGYRLGNFTKKAMTSDNYYEIGNFSRMRVSRFTKKDVYEFGDIAKTLWKKHKESQSKREEAELQTTESSPSSETPTTRSSILDMDNDTLKEFEEWDRNFLALQLKQSDSREVASERNYQDWDERLVKATTSGDDTSSELKRR